MSADRETVARLLHRAWVHWYESRLRQGARYGDRNEPFMLFPEVNEAFGSGQCVTARTMSEGIVGVCFSHEPDTHFAVVIVGMC